MVLREFFELAESKNSFRGSDANAAIARRDFYLARVRRQYYPTRCVFYGEVRARLPVAREQFWETLMNRLGWPSSR